ncbi:MAG TPA: class I SAM-dependent methyltransferase [Isosphaeraceae bacterium]|nr:class I SAM-dependent methyltransferase [Isosphaeraceae bacterium]
MLNLKERLKPWLLPLWNGGHRLAWRAGEYVDAVRRSRFEHCDACGRFGPVLYRRWVVPPRLEELWGLSPRLAEALARKESCECAWCGAKLRGRRLARVLLEAFPVGHPPQVAPSVAAWARSPEAKVLRIAEFNRIDGLHEQLRTLPGFAYSEFQEEVTPGTMVNGVRAEDLTRLTYSDATFDLVLTSETLEHVPDLAAALAELWRVLRPGGLHLFTVPRLPGVTATFARAVVAADGRVEHRAPAIRHPGGDVGYPVFTEFGADLPDVLRRAGLETTVHFGPTTEDDLAQVYAARKVGG